MSSTERTSDPTNTINPAQKGNQGRKKPRNLIGGLVKGAGFTLLCISGLTWGMLEWQRGKGLQSYQLAFASAGSLPVRCHASVGWEGQGPSPQVELDGHPIPCDFTLPPSGGALRVIPVNIKIPHAIPGGAHKGEIRIESASVSSTSGSESQRVQTYPIEVGIRSFNEQWSGPLWCLALTSALYLIFYALCRKCLAAPVGQLKVIVFPGNQRITCELRPTRASWFFPWHRSELPLKKVFSQNSLPLPIQAEMAVLVFCHYENPLLDLCQDCEGVRYGTFANPAIRPTNNTGAACPEVQIMMPDRYVIFLDPNQPQNCLLMTYT